MRHRFRRHQDALSSSARAGRAVLFRGTGRPAVLTNAAAAVLLSGAAVAAGVTTWSTTADAGGRTLAGDAHADYRVSRESAAATGTARPVARQPARPEGTAAPTQRSKPSPAPSPVQPAPEQPIQIYDSAEPAAIPAGVMCATYATGKYAVPGAAMAGRPTIWIDAWGTDPAASVLDVEPGDATPSMVPDWVAQHLTIEGAGNARIYTFRAEWGAVQQAVSTLPSWMQARVRWWIADPTGVAHMVPGASATQWYWGPGYDISTAIPGF